MYIKILKSTKLQMIVLLTALLLSVSLVLSLHKAQAATECSDESLGKVTQQYTVPSGQEGEYKLWVRMSAETAGNDSVWFKNDDGGCVAIGDVNVPVGSWKWVDYHSGNESYKTVGVNLSARTYTMSLIGRESGVKVDKVLFVKDTGCVPTDAQGNPCLTVIDTTPPQVSVSAPTSPLSGTKQLTAQASDNDAIKSVTFLLNGSPLTPADSMSPYTYDLDTTKYTNGTYKLTAMAEDVSGNKRTSTEISITINNVIPDTTKPNVSITNPPNSSTPIPEGSFTFSANASDNIAIQRVVFKLDGQEIGSDNSSPYSATTTLTKGTHTLEVTAVDTSNLEAKQTMSFTVTAPSSGGKACDFDSSGTVDLPDLARLLANWKKSVTSGKDGDCNGANGQPDGMVGIEDLGKLLALWKK